jgi:paraquat-inducible protein B
MSEKSNPTIIGAFVVGAIALLVIGTALFGGTELLAKRDYYVAYFVENTQGLRKGSNVMLNGVRIGHVSSVALIVDQGTFETKTEVIMEIMPESYIVTRNGITIGRGMDSSVSYDRLINEGGLRAILQVESFVTGQLLVELQSRSNSIPILRGGSDNPYREIPTNRSQIQELLANVQTWVADLGANMDPVQLGQQIQSALAGVDEIANSQDLRETLAGINAFVNNEDLQTLTTTLQATLDEIRRTAGDAGSLIRKTEDKLDAMVDLRPVIETLADTLEEAREAMSTVNFLLQGESIQVYQLGNTLREIEGAARATREFLDYLERNPEAFLKGKQP